MFTVKHPGRKKLGKITLLRQTGDLWETKFFIWILKLMWKLSNKARKEESTNWLEEELEFNLQADRPSVSVDVCSDNIN